MDFRHYWDALDADAKKALAKEADTSYHYLWMIAHGYRRAGAKTIASLGRVGITPQSLRPEFYK